MTGAAEPMEIESGDVPVPPAFVALTVALKDPALLGVPEINPVAALTLRPAGNPDAPKLVGLLLAVT
jgi:hypothetical protein